MVRTMDPSPYWLWRPKAPLQFVLFFQNLFCYLSLGIRSLLSLPWWPPSWEMPASVWSCSWFKILTLHSDPRLFLRALTSALQVFSIVLLAPQPLFPPSLLEPQICSFLDSEGSFLIFILSQKENFRASLSVYSLYLNQAKFSRASGLVFSLKWTLILSGY